MIFDKFSRHFIACSTFSNLKEAYLIGAIQYDCQQNGLTSEASSCSFMRENLFLVSWIEAIEGIKPEKIVSRSRTLEFGKSYKIGTTWLLQRNR